MAERGDTTPFHTPALGIFAVQDWTFGIQSDRHRMSGFDSRYGTTEGSVRFHASFS